MKHTDEYGVTRHIAFEPGYDMRHRDCGIHGMNLRFALTGPKGAVSFTIFTNMHLPHVAESLSRKIAPTATRKDLNEITLFFQPTGADISYHSREPLHDYNHAHAGCEWLDGAPCFNDGTFCLASEWCDEFLEKGESWVWAALEGWYFTIYGERIPDWYSALMEESERFLSRMNSLIELRAFMAKHDTNEVCRQLKDNYEFWGPRARHPDWGVTPHMIGVDLAASLDHSVWVAEVYSERTGLLRETISEGGFAFARPGESPSETTMRAILHPDYKFKKEFHL